MAKKAQASDISPEYVLLGMLYLQPDHGYDLHERIAHHLGQIWHLSLSQVYNILNRLEAHGYIVGVQQEQKKAPSRRRFALTTAGQHHFKTWLNQPTDASSHAIRVEFLSRLYFVRQAFPDNTNSLIDAQIADTRTMLTRLQAILPDLPQDQVFNRLGIELRVCQLTSILGWLSECRSLLAPPKEP